MSDLDLRQRTGVTVIGIQEAHDRLTAMTADPTRPLAAGDVLVVLGSLQASAALATSIAQATGGAAHEA